MSSKRFARLRELLLRAADLPAQERHVYLESVCKDDPELCREAEAILAHDQGTHEILKSDALLHRMLDGSLRPDGRDDEPRSPAPERDRDGGDLIGKTIGHHNILGCLGKGGMGVVYTARDARLDRIVALKVMRPESLGDAHKRLRFLQEARAASRLNHPGIVTIYEIDSSTGLDIIAMEYVEGPTLAERIPTGGVPVERTLRFGRQLADALAAAHAAGIVHRDLKPSNILIAPGERLKIADFGLAKLSDLSPDTSSTQRTLTDDGIVLGTAAYMSPEQAAGRAVDARSDLFSLGCILYEMLSGRRAFDGDSQAAIIASVLRDTPPPLADAPRMVGALVERCLQKNPESRFQCAADVNAAIEKCLRVDSPNEPGERSSVAVLPFANMSAREEDDYLCEGLAEEIINVLTTLPGLAVIARTSAFAVARLGLDAREIGERLGVDTILEGSVRRSGGRVRVTAQLVETTKGAHLWSERYDREMVDVLALEDEIAGAISTRLRGDMAQQRRVRIQQKIAPAAHEAYLEGRYHFARGSAEALGRARACYERALALESDFALAHESLAELYFFVGFSGTVPPRDVFARSAWHAARAIEIDETLAEAHALLANLRKEMDYDWDEVHRGFCRALALNPASPVVRSRRAISELMPLGRMDEALAEMEEALHSDPLSIWMHYWMGILLFLNRQPERVIDEGRRMIELEPSHPLAHFVLGGGYALAGRYAEAVTALERANRLSGGLAVTASLLAWTYGLAGQDEKARALLPAPGSSIYVSPIVPAYVHIGLREWDAAFKWLDRAIEVRDPHIVPIKTLPILDPIRDDPRYADLLRRMKLA